MISKCLKLLLSVPAVTFLFGFIFLIFVFYFILFYFHYLFSVVLFISVCLPLCPFCSFSFTFS